MFAVLNPFRKTIRCLSFLFCALLLAACQSGIVGGGNTGASINPRNPVPVAILIPHGSANPNEVSIARNLENAARLAIADLDGVQIDLRVYGTAGQPGQAQAAALKAVADGAKIILGPLHAESANAVAVAVASKNVNVLAFSNNTTIAGGNLFLLGHTFDNTAKRLVNYARGHGKSNILTVYSNNLAGQLGKQAIQTAISNAGVRSASSIGYDFSQQGVVSSVANIRNSAQNTGADAVFLTSNTAGALPLFSQLLPEAGLKPDVVQYIGLTRWDTPPQTLELPGVQGGWFAIPDPARTSQFRQRYTAAYGSSPHALSGLAYDGIAAIGALAKSGSRQALTRDSLTQSAGFQGVNGVFRFLPDGTNERSLAVATIQNKQVVVIDPAPHGFSGAGF